MVKTTITLEDDLYRKLAKEAFEKYGKTRGMSRLINEKLRSAEGMTAQSKLEIERAVVEKGFGSWARQGKTKTGAEYTKRLRREWEKRLAGLETEQRGKGPS